MKSFKPFALTALAFATLWTAPVLLAEEEDETPLGEEMSTMNKAWRRVRRYASDPERAATCLEYMTGIIEAAKKSKQYEPLRAQDIPEAEREAFLEAYRKEIDKLVKEFMALQAAFENGETEKAVAMVDKINDMRKHGHEEFQRPDEDDE